MKIFLLVTLLLFVACSDDSSSSANGGRDERVFGWRKDDFNPVREKGNIMGYGNLKGIYQLGDRIVLVDGHYSENEYTSPGKVTSTPRVFASRIGDPQWDTLYSSEWIRYVYGDSTGLYAGTELNGKVLKYDFDNSKWIQIYKLPFDTAGFYNVYGIAIYRGSPIVCFAGYDDKNDLREEMIKVFFKMQTDTGWVDVTYDYDSSKEYPFQFHKGLEHNEKLYAISGARGMWSFDGKNWKHLAKLPVAKWNVNVDPKDVENTVMDIVEHKGKLYVLGEKWTTSIFEYDEAQDKWKAIDSTTQSVDPNDSTINIWTDYVAYSNVALLKISLASDGKHLFAAGDDPSIPAVYMGDYGSPYEKEEKGWRSIWGNWCAEKYGKCMATGPSNDMIVVGDTLYVANYDGLLKFPLIDMDEAIADQKSYRTKDGE